MPYATVADIPPSLKKHKGVPLTAAQASKVAEIGDKAGNYAFAWAWFDNNYEVKNNRWVEKEPKMSALATFVRGAKWDATAAEHRIRRWAGGPDKEDIDWGKYGQAFAWHDKDAPDNLTSYKLPYKDIVDGKLEVHWGGLVGAMAALLGARGGVDIPAADRKAVYAKLAAEYRKLDREPPEYHTAEIVAAAPGTTEETPAVLDVAKDILSLIRLLLREDIALDGVDVDSLRSALVAVVGEQAVEELAALAESDLDVLDIALGVDFADEDAVASFAGNIKAITSAFDKWAEGSFTGCMTALRGKAGITSPEKLCAWMHKQALGQWPSEKKHKAKAAEGHADTFLVLVAAEGLSIEETLAKIRAAVEQKWPSPMERPVPYPCIVETHDDYLIVRVQDKYYRMPYTVKAGVVEVGEPVAVEQTFAPVKAGAAPQALLEFLEGYRTIKDVEIFATGKHQEATFTPKDLDEMVANFKALRGEIDPPVKLSHDEDNRGLPVAGWVESVRRVGDKLVADIKTSAKTFYDWIKRGGYRKRSVEIYLDYKDGKGKKWGKVLRALAFVPIPEVKNLKDIDKLGTAAGGLLVAEDGQRYLSIPYTEGGFRVLDEKEPTQGQAQAAAQSTSGQPPEPVVTITTLQFAELQGKVQEVTRLQERIARLEHDNKLMRLAEEVDAWKHAGKVVPAQEAKLLELLLGADETQGALIREVLAAAQPVISFAELGTSAPADTMDEDKQILFKASELRKVNPALSYRASVKQARDELGLRKTG